MTAVRSDLPSGTVTFLFTDIEGSTKLLHSLGAAAYADALAEHRHVLREAFSAHGGVEVDTQGDAFFVAFPTAPGALRAAAAANEGLAAGPIRVRMAIHTGTPLLGPEGYVGVDVHRGARIGAAGHGGQVLVSAATAALLGTDSLCDLGLHRLKDLSAPERIYQLGVDDFAPLKTLYQTNLPIPATPFLGREHELAEVADLLRRDELRLLTLTGPGGTGKTRLALQAAAEASESFPDGIYWVPLAPLRDPELVLSSVAQALGVKEEPDGPMQDTLGAHLAGKHLLLVLDNLEHLLPRATAPIAALRDANGLSLLVTSRERLRIRGEQTWPVPPLADKDGTALFVARARAVDPGFSGSAAVGELCARLDELPLAIELAAARTAVFSTEQLLDRLSQRLDLLKGERDADPRQQTLRATIEWSHDLLSESEQRLFRGLAIFVGGCTYDAAEQVSGADPDVLQSLLDKSLLRKRDAAYEPRYWMLETIREFAGERLEQSGEAEASRRRHAEHFMALAQEAEENTRSYSAEWIERLEMEHDNLRAALDYLAGSGEDELVLRLAGALSDFWYYGGHVAEGWRRLQGALESEERPTAARASALSGAASMAYTRGDAATARLLAEEALALHRRFGDTSGTAYALNQLGVTFIDEGDFERAEQFVKESVELFRQAGDELATVEATRTLAFTYYSRGEVERARLLHETNLRRAQALGFKEVEAGTLSSLASIAFDQGRNEDSLALRRANLLAWRDLGSLQGTAQSLCGTARALAMLLGRADAAAQLLSCFEGLGEQIGVSEGWVGRMNELTLAAIHSQLDAAAFATAWEKGQKLTVDEAVALALSSVEPA